MTGQISTTKKCPPVGAPAWMATFADMMSLLMAFFVLLLSFSTMDVIRFKHIAESFRDSFGVQREVPALDPPLGVSVIAQHFSPAQTDPTPLDEVRQSMDANLPTPLDKKAMLEVLQLKVGELKEAIVKMQQEDLEATAERIRGHLLQEVETGSVAVDIRDADIVISIREAGSFASGSAILQDGFGPVIKKIASAIHDEPGKVWIGGHTDNRPIATEKHRSNWELSASRAVSVAHRLLLDDKIDPVRVEIKGHADTQPLVANDTAENRAKNRRVEIVLVQDGAMN